MNHTPYRLLILILVLILSSTACSVKPSPRATTPATSNQPTAIGDLSTVTYDQGSATLTPQSPISTTSDPQSTIANPQSTITPPQATIINPQSTFPIPQSAISNPQSTIYHLSAQFDYYRQSLAIAETITYTNVTSQTLTDLLLVVPANRYPGAFQLRALRWADGEATQDFGLRQHRLSVLLSQPLLPGEQVTLSLEYDLVLPIIPEPSDAAPQPFGYTLAQSNLVDWYAYFPPYQDGWLVHDPGFWGEYQVFTAGDYHVDLTVVNSPEGLVVAASTLPYETVPGSGITYRYHMESARTFVLSISPSYQVFSQTVELDGKWVTIYSYAYAYHVQAGQAVLAETARAVDLYSGLFGTYPRDTLSVVEADFLDGMEYDGLYFLSKGFYNLYDGTPNGYLTAIAVHETAHQWWYGLVSNDQALEPWLDEALCTFMERVYYERFYPEALSGWWQPYRVDYYEPRGLVGGSIYDYASYRAYRDGVYLHGQEFLQTVRERMGDEAFFTALKDYASRYRGRIATGQDFLGVLAQHSVAGIEDLVEAYIGK